jgi:UrcA family protein
MTHAFAHTFSLSRASQRVTSAVAAVAMTALMAIASDARAESRFVDVAPSHTIEYSSAAVATEQGAAELYRKLRSAARSVCKADGGTVLERRIATRACIEKSLENAVNQVNMQPLTALHLASTRAVS